MDFARGVAAFLVVISHVRSLLFVDYPSVKSTNSAVQIFYFFTGLGHPAVVVFFVLSGYLIVNSIVRQVKANEFDLSQYLISRFSRLYAVLIIALILTFLFDSWGSNYDFEGIYNNSRKFAALNFSVSDRLSLKHFITSLFMLQNIILPPLGSNGPLWSLNYEFWFYLLFPSLFFTFTLLRKRQNKFWLYLTSSACMLFLLPQFILQAFMIWLLGVIPIYLRIRSTILQVLLAMGMGLLAILEPLFQRYDVNSYWIDLGFGITFTLLLCTLPNVKVSSSRRSLIRFISSFSYSLYLVHMPLVLCFLTIVYYFSRAGLAMQPSMLTFMLFCICIVLCYFVAYLLATVTEYKTERIRIFVSRAYGVLHIKLRNLQRDMP